MCYQWPKNYIYVQRNEDTSPEARAQPLACFPWPYLLFTKRNSLHWEVMLLTQQRQGSLGLKDSVAASVKSLDNQRCLEGSRGIPHLQTPHQALPEQRAEGRRIGGHILTALKFSPECSLAAQSCTEMLTWSTRCGNFCLFTFPNQLC